MNVIWDAEAEDEAYAIATRDSSSCSAVAEIYETFSKFGRTGVPKLGIACPLINSAHVCYWPETDIKGFFCFDDDILYVAHVAETRNDFDRDAALAIAEQRYLDYLAP